MIDAISLLFLLFAGHALADYPLQGEFLAMGKNRHIPSLIPGTTIWPWCLSAHAFIHGGLVALLTGSPALGMAEAVIHWVIDWGKCEKLYGFHFDQILHLVCKLWWVALVYTWGLSL